MINVWIKITLDFLLKLYYHPDVGRKFDEDEKSKMWEIITILRWKLQ